MPKNVAKRSAKSILVSMVVCTLLGGCNAMHRSDLAGLEYKEPLRKDKYQTGVQDRDNMLLEARYQELLLSERIMQVAEPWMGVRYRYGGTTPKGFDCSGFTRAVFSQLNMELPRSSREQAEIGLAVPREQLKPGDLVFFDIRRSGRVSHVGIYIGNGEIIHAARHSGVVVDTLSDDYYDTRYYSARRVIDYTNIIDILAGMNGNTSM